MLSIDIEYLSGVCYASELHDDGVAEWPPSPDRLFSALVDAMSSRSDGRGGDALRWLESQDPPEVACPPHGRRDACLFWVPVQDKRDKGRYLNDRGPGLPAVTRKPRRFPAVVLPDGERTVTMSWDAEPPPAIMGELGDLAACVPRLGHSSSLVRMAVRAGGGRAGGRMRFVPDRNGRMRIRCPYRGRLDDLLDGYRRAERDGAVWHPRPPAVWPRYAVLDGAAEAARPRLSPMDGGSWSVLAVAGAAPAPESFPLVAKAVRSAIVDGAGRHAPEAISGIAPGGGPSQRPHMAIVPMLNVGWRHSDGGLLGLSVVMPPAAGRGSAEQGMVDAALGNMIGPERGIDLPGGLRLHLEPAGDRLSLQAGRYTGTSRAWVTATPIAVDRHAKPGRDQGIGIADSVERMGLPRPASVTASRGGLSQGVLHAARWVRHAGRGGLWHARIEFGEAVTGPVMVGAGRYRGLGLCMQAEAVEDHG